MYKENPKTAGSGIVCCIPQTGVCPIKCDDCFFQGGRSYLEPLADNLPNMPAGYCARNVVRVNDGNDSNNKSDLVMEETKHYPMKFYNTSISKDIERFNAPVVLTLNPGKMTDCDIHILYPIPKNLMFVRVRTNTWNLGLVRRAIEYYAENDIAVVLTFMAYYSLESIPEEHRSKYIYRKRTLNSYYAITTEAWRSVMQNFEDEIRVYSCGKMEGEKGKTSCKYCGNCLREYFATQDKMFPAV
ncbi:MAG: hypothetical protein M0Q12_06075 [Synergistaceae bacterium]|jgi:hypothetical protein|nr:hypothetical protein [Synergistaceae bacterium]